MAGLVRINATLTLIIAFPNENSLLKLLYAGILNASEKWTMPVQNWSLALSQFAIYFEGRLDNVLDI